MSEQLSLIARTKTGPNKKRSYNSDYMAEGKIAEEVVFAFLKQHPYVVDVQDWRDLKLVHEADVDCAIVTIDGRVRLAEIKSDTHLGVTNNVLFEVLRINHTCAAEHATTLGWSARSPANYFLYYSPMTKSIYQCKPDDLRKALQAYTKESRKKTNVQWINTDNIKSTLVILIPWQYCNGFFHIWKIGEDLKKYDSKLRNKLQIIDDDIPF